MAEHKDEAAVDYQPVEQSHSFVEVICKCTGKSWRFAAGTEAKFALKFINSSSVDSILANQSATYIEAVKDGEVPVIFGPNSILVNYGKGWKLQPVSETTKSFSRGKPDGYAAARAAYIPLIVHFRALEKPKEYDFCLELAKSDTYDEVVERVAQRLGVDDSSKIRLTPHNCYSQQPKPKPIKYQSVDHLVDMLTHYNKISDILYYEVLDIPLPELQCLKTLKVDFHHSMKDEIEILNVRLPKQSTVGDVLNEIKSKVELSHPNAELRLLEVFYHKIYKIFPLSEKVENINDQYWTLQAEEIPEEEKNLGPLDRLIHVYHFTKETLHNQMEVQNFGVPLLLVIYKGETLAEIKVRIQKKLHVPDEEFSKWKFAFLSLGRPEYLQDSDIVSSRFQTRDVYGAWEQYLGLEHADNTSKRSRVNQGSPSPPGEPSGTA